MYSPVYTPDELYSQALRATGRSAQPHPQPAQPTDPNAPPPDPNAQFWTQMPAPRSVAETWTPPPAAAPPPQQSTVTQQMLEQAQNSAPVNQERSNALYDQLSQRATQGLDVTRNDPVIRTQADAYAAQEERARRDYLADLAEREGPLANLRGETRMAAERMGQRVGSFEAELLGRELTARREEIAQALQQMGGLLSTDQQRELQRQIALMDNAIAQQQAANQGRSLDQDWQTALLQNEEFLRELAEQQMDRRSYYDAVQRGFIL